MSNIKKPKPAEHAGVELRTFPPRPVKTRRTAEAMLEDIKRDFPKTLSELAK